MEWKFGSINFHFAEVGIEEKSLQPVETIEIRVERSEQLFETLDPFPFRSRDLSRDADEYMFDRAREATDAVNIVVFLSVADEDIARDLHSAFSSYFSQKAERISKEIGDLFSYGRRSLLLGIAVLLICFLSGQTVSATMPSSYFTQSLEEGLIIVGWVANWKPIEIFLYDWWPLVQKRRTYLKLARAKVDAILL